MRHALSGGARIAFAEQGPADAPPLLLLHALGSDHTLWDREAARLASSFRVLRPDLRGHGASEAPPGPYTLAELAGDVLAVADAAGVDRAHVCGLSLGGMLALWLGIHHPARVRSLVVANSAARIATREIWQARIDAVVQGGMAAVRQAALGRFFSAGFAARHPRIVARAGAVLDRTDPAGYTGCCAALRDADLGGLVSSITAPLLVITGGQDASTPPREGRWLKEQVPRAALVELEEAGHLGNLERPDAFADAIASFLAARAP